METAPITVYADVHLEIWACLRFSAHQSTFAQMSGGGSCEATLSPGYSQIFILYHHVHDIPRPVFRALLTACPSCRLGPGPVWVGGQGVKVAGSTFSSVPF